MPLELINLLWRPREIFLHNDYHPWYYCKSYSRIYHIHNTYMTKLIFSTFKILLFIFIFNLCSTKKMERKAIPKAHQEETGGKVTFSYPKLLWFIIFFSFLNIQNYLLLYLCTVYYFYSMILFGAGSLYY